MSKLLVAFGIQNDFVYGVLGTKESGEVFPEVEEKIKKHGNNPIIFVLDSFDAKPAGPQEVRLLPKHCIIDTTGWQYPGSLQKKVIKIMMFNSHAKVVDKKEISARNLPGVINLMKKNGAEISEIELVGFRTDVCIMANAIILQFLFPNTMISVCASCCAGTSPEEHENALRTMKTLGIQIKREQ